MPDHVNVVAQVSRSEVIAMVLKNIRPPNLCWPADQVYTTVRSAFVVSCDHLLIQFDRFLYSSRSAWSAMSGHVWNYARAELRGCGQRVGVVPITDGAGCEHLGHDVRLGRSAEMRGAPLHLRPVAGCYCILQSFPFRSITVLLRTFAVFIALSVRHFGCCLG